MRVCSSSAPHVLHQPTKKEILLKTKTIQSFPSVYSSVCTGMGSGRGEELEVLRKQRISHVNDTTDERISNGMIAMGKRIILEMIKGGGEFIQLQMWAVLLWRDSMDMRLLGSVLVLYAEKPTNKNFLCQASKKTCIKVLCCFYLLWGLDLIFLFVCLSFRMIPC